MPFYDANLTEDQLKRMVDEYRCNECGGILTLAWGGAWKINGYVIRCSNSDHSTIAPKRNAVKSGKFDYREYLMREVEMEEKIGKEGMQALATIPRQGQLTQSQAMHILQLVYPKAPQDEIIRCAILCKDFGLHPLMREVYLIPFKDKSGKENYATVLGINATRKLIRGSYSYTDDTPRLMTEPEQKRVFGEVDTENIVAITKLRTKDGLEAPGYGKWPKNKEPYGTDKGNTKVNMAFIRSERNAFGRLSPDALPLNVDIIDEAYANIPDIGKVNLGTGEIIEGEVKEIEAEKPKTKKGKAKEEPLAESSDPLVEPVSEVEPEKDETPITDEQVTNLVKLMNDTGIGYTDLAAFCNKEKKWNIRDFKKELKVWQYNEILKAFEKGLA